MSGWREKREGVGHLYHLRDKGFTQISGRQALYNMIDKGILDAEKNGVLLWPNVIVQKKNKGVVKEEKRYTIGNTKMGRNLYT